MRPLLCSDLSAIAGATKSSSAPSCQDGRLRFGGQDPQGLRRTAHNAPTTTNATAAATNGQAGMPLLPVLAAAAGPGVPVPGTVSRNDQDPDTTWPSADVTR